MAAAPRSRILVVEDDESIQNVYRTFFESLHHGEFLWVLAGTGKQALDTLARHPSPPVDAVLLDWTLPDMDGLRVLKLVRSGSSTRYIPVFMVTGHDAPEDRVTGFEAGADDYMTKPVRERELLARLRGVLRRRQWALEEHGAFNLEDLSFDTAAKQFTVAGERLDLTPTELGLLFIFTKRPNVVHSQEYLWEAVWGYDSVRWKETLKKHLSNLRKKLGPKWGERVQTREGRGYILSLPLSVLHA